MYTEGDLVRIAKRDNNKKRNYLVVNPLQGKHIPVLPSRSLKLFDALAEQVQACWQGEQLLLVGFAETATAIGAGVAVYLGCDYIQTTREIIEGVTYLFFSEAHSHATEQKLVREDMDLAVKGKNRIVFIEDEVTTGNTILNIVMILKERYPALAYGVASLLNGMTEASLDVYREHNIAVTYLVKTCHTDYDAIADRSADDGVYHEADFNPPVSACREYAIGGGINARRLVRGTEYAAACESLWEQTECTGAGRDARRILVLGTEEFMYPALYLAGKLEAQGRDVRFHATTRSPICVSRGEQYPLRTRCRLASVYDRNRVTFLYNLGQYDLVWIVTDARDGGAEGLNTIVNALAAEKNTNIQMIRWCADENFL